MKEKIKLIVLLLLFIIMLVLVKMLLDYENKNIQTNTSVDLLQENNVNSSYQAGNSSSSNDNTQVMNGENLENQVLEVTQENFETEVLKESKKVLIDFYADWCGPCQVLSPIVEEVAKSNSEVKVVRINIDNAENIAINYGIMSIPTLVVIENGKEVKRSVGLVSQTEIEALIK